MASLGSPRSLLALRVHSVGRTLRASCRFWVLILQGPCGAAGGDRRKQNSSSAAGTVQNVNSGTITRIQVCSQSLFHFHPAATAQGAPLLAPQSTNISTSNSSHHGPSSFSRHGAATPALQSARVTESSVLSTLEHHAACAPSAGLRTRPPPLLKERRPTAAPRLH